MIYRGSLPQVTFRFFLACYALVLVLALSYAYVNYRADLREVERRRDYVESLFTHHLTSHYDLAQRVLREVAAQVALSKGDLPNIRSIIDREVNQKGFTLRVAWSDATMQLRVGTAIALFEPDADTEYLKTYHLDLKDRNYIRRARATPGEVVVSRLLHHKVTGRSFYAIALGVADAQGQYLGTLASVVDREPLADMMQAALDGGVLLGSLHLPGGESVFSNLSSGFTGQEEVILTGGYHLTVMVSPQYEHQLIEHYFFTVLLLLIIITLLFLVFYHSFARRLTEPVQEALQLLFGLNLQDKADMGKELALPVLLPKIRALQELMRDYDDIRSQLDDKEGKLHAAAELLLDVRQEYYGTLGSLSQELQQVFDAIQHYGEFCRDASLEDADDVYQQHFEVEEFGLNLKFIANALYLLCQENYGKLHLHAEPLFVDACVEESLARCREVIEDKTLDIRYTATQTHFRHDETFIRYLIDGVIYSVWRYMAYASKAEITVEVTGQGGQLQLTAHVKELEDIFLPPQSRDASLFIPSRRKSSAEDITRHLEGHINIKMLRLLARVGGGTLSCTPHEKGMRLQLVIPPVDK